jgi:hypothetical protein
MEANFEVIHYRPCTWVVPLCTNEKELLIKTKEVLHYKNK